MENSIRELLDNTMTEAKSLVDGCELMINKGTSFSLSSQKGKIDKYKVAGSQILGIRVIKNYQSGISYSEDLSPESIKLMISNAVENAKFSDEDRNEEISIKQDPVVNENSTQHKIECTTEEKIEFSLSLEKDVFQHDSRITSAPYNGFSEIDSEYYFLNSLGTFCYEKEGYYSASTSALLKENDNTSLFYNGGLARDLKNINKDKLIEDIVGMAKDLLVATPIRTGQYDVVFEPDVFNNLFSCFKIMFSGKAAKDQTNPMRDKLNKFVFDDRISISDVADYQDAFFKYAIDSEGCPRNKMNLIESGKLTNFYHNTATANYFKTQTTGHASRGPTSSLGVAGTNLVFGAGSDSADDVWNGEVIEIHKLDGLHSGTNAISGDFSLGAAGYFCKDGKRIRPVKGITVAGNFYDMLNSIATIGTDLKHDKNKSLFLPDIRFKNLSIAGS